MTDPIEEERAQVVEQALYCAEHGRATNWPVVAAILADEIYRLSKTDDEFEVEWRGTVRGWKHRPDQTFINSTRLFTEEDASSYLERQSRRIGEDVEAFQPHITDVIVEKRYVSPFRTVAETRS